MDVGAQNASLQMNLLTSQLPDANPITIGDLGVGVLELQNGSIEALAVAKGNAEMILDSNPDLMICPWEFEVAAEYEANVILITKGETSLLNIVNEALAKAYADGLYGTMVRRRRRACQDRERRRSKRRRLIANNKPPAVGDLSGGRRGRIRP